MRYFAYLLVALFLASPVAAKPLYVSPIGDDNVTYAANSPASPWRTIGRAAWGSANKATPVPAQAAQAGDVVHIAPGVYVTGGNLTGGGGGRQDVAYQPVNHGQSGAPIRFECEQIGACVLTLNSGAGPTIGSTERNYIEWSGFSLNEATAPTRGDTGPVTFFRVTGGSIENSTLVGNPNWTARNGDNYNGVRLEDANGVRVVNNRISDYGGQTGDRNHSGLTSYRSKPLIIENNLIENCGSGLYLKAAASDPQALASVRFNVIRNNRFGINVLLNPHTQSAPMLIAQNVITGNREAGLWLNRFDGGVFDSKWIRFVNNTLVNNAAAMASYAGSAAFAAGSNFLLQNNIIAGTGQNTRVDTVDLATTFGPTSHRFDRNVYATETFELAGQAANLAAWRARGQDVNGIIAAPQFVSGTDYRLAPTSPARNVGRAVHGIGGADDTVIPAGAYITGTEVLGPGGTTTPPQPPVDCAGTWSPWTRVAGSETACVASQRTFTETQSFTVTTSPANGGQACPASPVTRTATEACVMPPAPLVVTAGGATRTCTLVAAANQPPTTQSGWGVQFSRRPAGTTEWTAQGARDAAAPYTRSATVALGAWDVQAVWTRTGSAAVTVPGIATWTCE